MHERQNSQVDNVLIMRSLAQGRIETANAETRSNAVEDFLLWSFL